MFLHFDADDFPLKNPFKKCSKIVFLSLWRAAIRVAVVRSYIAFCNYASADRRGMAASRFLAAAAALHCSLQLSLCRSLRVVASRLLAAVAACVILLSFAAESRKSHCSGCA